LKNKFKNEKLYKILKNYNVELLDDYVNNRIRQNYKCLKCGNIFESSLVIIQQGYKCRKCYPAKRRYPDSFKEQLDKLKIKLLDNSYINEKYLHNWKCLKCNSEFKEKWNRLRVIKIWCF
jgi:DNA-directed RNA polymerase subunit RPC12/RpoP